MEEPPPQLDLWAPDWGGVDTVRRSKLPFLLWQVGDQSLLAHWMDHAVNEGHEKVVLHVADRPAEVRTWLKNATLWPLETEVVPEKKAAPAEGAPVLDRLPWMAEAPPEPVDGWALVELWHRLGKEWFSHYSELLSVADNFLAIGRGCQIHPGAQLHPPFWIGDEVSIGPGCRIGPDVAIGSGSLLAGNSHVENARVCSNTYLAADTELVEGVLEGACLYNLRHRARVEGLDALIAGEVKPAGKRVPPGERLLALGLLLRHGLAARRARKRRGEERALALDDRPLLLPIDGDPRVHRWPLYGDVVRGRRRLFGIPPYYGNTPSGIDGEWERVLREAAPGVFGLADARDAARLAEEERLPHDLYQAGANDEEEMASLVRRWLRTLSGKKEDTV